MLLYINLGFKFKYLYTLKSKMKIIKQSQSQFQSCIRYNYSCAILSIVIFRVFFGARHRDGVKFSIWLFTVATEVRLGVEKPGSSSHCDTAGEGSAFGVADDGDSICSIPQEWSIKPILLKYYSGLSQKGVTSQSYIYKLLFSELGNVEV